MDVHPINNNIGAVAGFKKIKKKDVKKPYVKVTQRTLVSAC